MAFLYGLALMLGPGTGGFPPPQTQAPAPEDGSCAAASPSVPAVRRVSPARLSCRSWRSQCTNPAGGTKKSLAGAAVWHRDRLLPPHCSLPGDILSPPAISLCQKGVPWLRSILGLCSAPAVGMGHPPAPAAENQGHKQRWGSTTGACCPPLHRAGSAGDQMPKQPDTLAP